MDLHSALPPRVIRKTRSEDLKSQRDLPQRPTIITTNMNASSNRPSHHYARAHSQGSITLQDSRPLPSPPTPGPLSAPVKMRTVRPLPLPPPTPLSSSEPTFRVIPPTPLPPPTPLHKASTSTAHLKPPCTTTRPKPFSSLSLQTSLDSLHPPSLRSDEFAPSPLSPSIPLKPSPSDARKKRMSKLRRHLGESVTESTMFHTSVAHDEHEKITSIDEEEQTHYLSGLIFSKTHLDLHDGSSTSDESEESMGQVEEEEDVGCLSDGDELCWVVDNNSASIRTTTLRRLSKKWIREKGGHRWEEQDYTDILRTLRSL
ncbi:hypothetical protein L218DRAFT_966757 [Marasmius fiardii PR-910]|nr:hypothetical protein L218DRAFT_966757 [Marasmius fiardii PR-910]